MSAEDDIRPENPEIVTLVDYDIPYELRSRGILRVDKVYNQDSGSTMPDLMRNLYANRIEVVKPISQGSTERVITFFLDEELDYGESSVGRGNKIIEVDERLNDNDELSILSVYGTDLVGDYVHRRGHFLFPHISPQLLGRYGENYLDIQSIGELPIIGGGYNFGASYEYGEQLRIQQLWGRYEYTSYIFERRLCNQNQYLITYKQYDQRSSPIGENAFTTSTSISMEDVNQLVFDFTHDENGIGIGWLGYMDEDNWNIDYPIRSS